MGFDGFKQRPPQFFRRCPPLTINDGLHARLIERLVECVFGLGDAVAVHHQDVTWFQHRGARRVGRVLEHAERHPTGA